MPDRQRFGLFDFDPVTRELRREGVPVRLQAQPAQVLALLLEHAGEVVTREQLQRAVWGTETFVDFERGLNFCIAQIRSALGDSAESPRFVRTIPKQGYQFIAPVAPVATATPTRRVAWRYALATGVLVVAGALLVGSRAQRPPTNVAVMRFDNETGNAEMDRFADGLTDVVVTELTAAGAERYGVIGNAAILRRPRSERDLKAIGTTLGASYVILGQVQRYGAHLRMLAHLIRLPEQTHVWVVRLDRDVTDPLQTESEVARQIAMEFAPRLTASPNAATH